EDDGSETGRGSNPRDPSDGRVRPPRFCAYPGVKRVKLRFSIPPRVVGFEIQRAEVDGREVKFEVHIPFLRATSGPEFSDREVLPGSLYAYRMISIGPNGERSAPSNVCVAGPQDDPNAPH